MVVCVDGGTPRRICVFQLLLGLKYFLWKFYRFFFWIQMFPFCFNEQHFLILCYINSKSHHSDIHFHCKWICKLVARSVMSANIINRWYTDQTSLITLWVIIDRNRALPVHCASCWCFLFFPKLKCIELSGPPFISTSDQSKVTWWPHLCPSSRFNGVCICPVRGMSAINRLKCVMVQ